MLSRNVEMSKRKRRIAPRAPNPGDRLSRRGADPRDAPARESAAPRPREAQGRAPPADPGAGSARQHSRKETLVGLGGPVPGEVPPHAARLDLSPHVRRFAVHGNRVRHGADEILDMAA